VLSLAESRKIPNIDAIGTPDDAWTKKVLAAQDSTDKGAS
jgi:hypothetical protein